MDLAAELDPARHIVTLVKVQLYPAEQSVHVEEAAYEYVPLSHGIFTPPLQADPASQAVQLVDPAPE